MSRQKTRLGDLDNAIYDVRDADESSHKTSRGLDAAIVAEISEMKNEPRWMLDLRLHALALYGEMALPAWGPALDELDMEEIVTYVRPNVTLQNDWAGVPASIKDTFDRLGVLKAERESLAGVGAQYDSEFVYRSLKEELRSQGVIYTDMETAVRQHEDLVRAHFMALVHPSDHKFAALHGAAWSGGSFVYVPEGTRVAMPLQSYYRLNAPGSGQFEHTLIIVEKGASVHFIEGCSAPRYDALSVHAGCVELYVGEGATLRYSAMENWSKNMINLSTKRALVERDGKIEWVSGTFGAHIAMLYPSSILKGEGAKAEYTGVTFARSGQHLDTGTQVVHAAPNTSSTVSARSISRDGGVTVNRSAISIRPEASGSKSSVICESLMMDRASRADTIPVMDVRNDQVDIGHEARIGRVSDTAVFYLMSRGLTEEEAKATIVRGFVEPVAKELPLEYAAEMNRIITLELEGTIG